MEELLTPTTTQNTSAAGSSARSVLLWDLIKLWHANENEVDLSLPTVWGSCTSNCCWVYCHQLELELRWTAQKQDTYKHSKVWWYIKVNPTTGDCWLCHVLWQKTPLTQIRTHNFKLFKNVLKDEAKPKGPPSHFLDLKKGRNTPPALVRDVLINSLNNIAIRCVSTTTCQTLLHQSWTGIMV